MLLPPKNIVLVLVLMDVFAKDCLLAISVQGNAQGDYNEIWNRPTISHASFGFKYVFFGAVSPTCRKPGINFRTIPPIPGLKYRSCSNFCLKDTCYATRFVLAVRCPKNQLLLQWASKRMAMYTEICLRNSDKRGLDSLKALKPSSAADICNAHIRYINSAYAKENCSGDLTHNIPNYQVGVLLTDCWRTERFCTFYEAHWHDWASCGDTTTESYHTIDLKTGNKLELSDLIKEEDYPALADIMMDYLKSYNGYYWRDIDHSSGHLWPITALGVLKEINGCALIREGLILYFYPYHIGCGADGQFNAIIPYKRLKGIMRFGPFV